MKENRKTGSRLIGPLAEMFGVSRAAALSVIAVLLGVVLFAFFWFFHSAPPRRIILTSGGVGTSSDTNAMKYRQFLARNGVKLAAVASEGSLQNLERLEDPAVKVDVGFVLGGMTNTNATSRAKLKLVSLGSIAYQPLLVFYRGAAITLLSELKGKRLAIGPVGSGTRSLALTLLQFNHVEPGADTVFEDLEAEPAAKALLDGAVDAIFLMGDSASPQLMRQLLVAPSIHLLDFPQADGYVRRVSYLNKLQLPQGSIDFGNNIPAHDVSLLAPTVELLVRPTLHPVLCDLLLDAAQEAHGGAGLFKKRGEFPSLVEHDFPISPEAIRYSKSGKGFLYRSLPFPLASLINRLLVAFVPAVVLIVPVVRLLPTLLRLGTKLRIYRWYRALMVLERDLRSRPADQHPQLLARLDLIEREVNKMKMPASFADQYYTLRGSIGFVRERIGQAAAPKA